MVDTTDTSITLITPVRRQDPDGVWRDGTPVTREIPARKSGVIRSEFYAGGHEGLKPEIQFTIFNAEYRGEKELIWNGEAYVIYRTYPVRDTDDLEIYVGRKVGVHNG